MPDETPETTNLGQFLTGPITFTKDPAYEERVARYVASLSDVTAEFHGTYDTAAAAPAFTNRPRVAITVTLTAPPGERFTQADADVYLGRHLILQPAPDTPTYAGRVLSATVTDDGATIELTGEITS